MPTQIYVEIEDRLPAYSAVAYQRGAIVNGAQAAVNTVTVHAGHDFATSDKFLYALDRTNILYDRVFTVSSAASTSVTFSGATFSFPDSALLVNIGQDTGATEQSDGSFTLPNWDASDKTMYSDPNGDDSITSVRILPSGEVGFWVDSIPIWLMTLTHGSRPCRVYLNLGANSQVVTRSATEPSAPNLGDIWIKVQGTDLPDIVYVYIKHGDETNDWAEVNRGQAL